MSPVGGKGPTLDDVRAGAASMAQVRIGADTLRRQADVARTHGNPQLAENFERGAELTALSDAELLAVYEQLRPRRATADELEATAADLAARVAPLAARSAAVASSSSAVARRGRSCS